jgi:PAS domain S-box-containing protein
MQINQTFDTSLSPASPSPLGSRVFRFLKSAHLWAALGVVFLFWILTGPDHTERNRRIGILTSVLFFFVAATLLGRCARRPGISKDLARGLRWIAGSQVLYGLGTLYGFFTVLYLPGYKARFDVSDVFYLAGYPTVLMGLVFMPRVEQRSASRARILIDTVVFLVGVGLPLWLFTLSPGVSKASLFEGSMFIGYPLASFTGITILNFILLTRAPQPSRTAFSLLVAAICVVWLSDLIYLLDSVHGLVATGPVDWSNASSALSTILFILAAGRIETGPISGRQEVQAAATSPLPIATIVAVSGWLVLFMLTGHPDPDTMARILMCLVLLFVVLSVREAFVFRDGKRWLAAEIDREARARFEVLVQHTLDVIMLVDSQYTIRFANPAVADALGVSAHDIVGQPLLRFAHEEDMEKGTLFLDIVSKSATNRSSLRWRLRHANRTYRVFDTLGARTAIGSSLAGMVITSRDMTQQVARDETLRQSEKIEALGQLVGGIAHNFNNILTATMMRLGLLKGHKQLPQDALEEVIALDREAKRSAELTRKLVLFGTRQNVQRKTVNIGDSLNRLLPEIHQLLGDAIQLHLAGGSSPKVVLADGDLLDYMVMSLCANARDAMPDGGCLIIEIAEMTAEELAPDPKGAPRPASVIRLSFQDNGCGMDHSTQQRLFEPFFTTKAPNGGHGLGLASVHGAVKMHQGWMQVESSPGKGSTFRIFLPCESRSPAASLA